MNASQCLALRAKQHIAIGQTIVLGAAQFKCRVSLDGRPSTCTQSVGDMLRWRGAHWFTLDLEHTPSADWQDLRSVNNTNSVREHRKLSEDRSASWAAAESGACPRLENDGQSEMTIRDRNTDDTEKFFFTAT